jgi:hypothetical protein
LVREAPRYTGKILCRPVNNHSFSRFLHPHSSCRLRASRVALAGDPGAEIGDWTERVLTYRYRYKPFTKISVCVLKYKSYFQGPWFLGFEPGRAGPILTDQRTFLLRIATGSCAQRKIRVDSLVSVIRFYSAFISSRSSYVNSMSKSIHWS